MDIDISIFNDYKNPDNFLFPESQIDSEYTNDNVTIPNSEDLITPDLTTIFEQNIRTLEQVINEVNTTLTNNVANLKTSLLNQISGVNSSLSGTISVNYQEYLESLSQIQSTLNTQSHQIFSSIPEQISLNAQAIETARTDFTNNLENAKNLLETQTNSLIQSIQTNIDDVNYQLTHGLNLNSLEISDLIDNEIAALQNNLEISVETINVAIVSGNSILNERMEELTTSITTLGNQVVTFIDPNKITYIEANNLNLSYLRIMAESEDIIDIAILLNILNERVAYQSALAALHSTLNPWIEQPVDSYPINISDSDRVLIETTFEDVETTKSVLVNKISENRANNVNISLTDYINYSIGEFSEVTNALSTLNSQLMAAASDNYISLAEANSLKLSLVNVVAESNDIIDLATASGIIEEKTAYQNALNNLQNLLLTWIDKPLYPLAITEVQRTSIIDAFSLVQSTKSDLSKVVTLTLNTQVSVNLTSYIDEQINQVSTSLSDLDSSFISISSDANISAIEANTLKLQLEQVESESTDIVNSAVLVGITAEKIAYSTSLLELSTGLSRWINQINYPLPINLTERQDIINKFKNVQDKKSTLINAIRNKQTSGISSNVDTLSSLMTTSIDEISTLLNSLNNQFIDISSDNVITFTESESLKLVLNQVLFESQDILSLATSISSTLSGTEKTTFDTKLTNYSNAITSLNSLLIQWINQSIYPKSINTVERTNISNAFNNVQSTKSILSNAVTQALDTNTSNVITSYIDDQILDVNTSLTSFSDQLTLYASDGALTLAEANALKLSLSQIQSESTYILNEATLIGVNTAEKTNYQIALSTLVSLVTPWIDLPLINGVSQYPITISNTQRVAIKNAFNQLQSTKTILVNTIKTKQIDVNVASLTFQIETSASNLGTQVNNLSSEIRGAIESLHNDLFLEVHQRESLSTVVEQYNNTLKGSILSTQSQTLASIGNVTSNTALNLALLRQDLESQLGSQVSDLSARMTAQGVTINATIAQHVDTLNNRVSLEVDNLQNTIDVKTVTLTDGIDVIQTDLINGFYEANISISDLQDNWKRRIADARVVWDSPSRIGLESQVTGNVGAIFVQEELIIADSSVDVLNTHPVIDLLSHDSTNLIASCIKPNTEYFIYIANHDRDEFNLPVTLSVGDYPEVVARDTRGKLFLSTTPDYDGYLGSVAPGISARIVGQVNTDSTSYSQGGPFFVREINISWIAKDVSLPETFHEHCDFTLEFIDEETLSLVLVDGLYGQVFVGGELIVIEGTNSTLTRDKIRVVWIGGNNPVGYTDQAIVGNADYYVYLANNDYSWNFNDINPNTLPGGYLYSVSYPSGRPWIVEDDYAVLFYDPDFDLRKSIFLSSKNHEHGYLSEQYPGYLARYIGVISTDDNGLFIYSNDLSAIRSLQLKPSYLNGLAEVSIFQESTATLKLVRKRGTSGVIMVGARPIQTYDSDHPEVHSITTSSTIFIYDEDEDFCLVTSDKSSTYYTGQTLHVYLTNDNDYWGLLYSNKLFLTTQSPDSNAYLSKNFPGNTARWIMDIRLSSNSVGTDIITNGRFELGSGITANNWSGTNWSWLSTEYNMNFSAVAAYDVSSTGQTNCSAWENILGCTMTQTTPGSVTASTIYYAISFDNKVTWKIYNGAWISIVRNSSGTYQYYNGSTWVNASSLSNAMELATSNASYQWTKAQIESMLDNSWEESGGWSNSVNTIDWTYRLISGSSYATNNTSTTRATQILSSDGTWPNPGSTYGSYYFTGACWKAFNGTNNNSEDCWVADYWGTQYWISPGVSSPFLGYSFGSSNPKLINKYMILSRNGGTYSCSPKSFSLWGSNAVSGPYTRLDVQVNVPLLSSNTYWTSGTLLHTTKYSYYILTVEANWVPEGVQTIEPGQYNTRIGELILVEAETVATTPTFSSYMFRATGAPFSALTQSLTPVIGTTYEVVVTTTAIASGSVTPKLGGVIGTPITTTERNTQYITPITSTGIEIYPSGTFTGAIDNISCIPVYSTKFSGDSISDAVVESGVKLNDIGISDSTTWSSKRIVEEILSWFSAGGLNSIWTTQKAYGLGLLLEYVDSNTLLLRSVSDSGTTVVFPTTPSYSTRFISRAGITFDISGSANTRYYVYLTSSSIYLSTSSPTQLYPKLEILGTTSLRIGDVYLTGTNSMSGSWNICSAHNEPYRVWTQSFTTVPFTMNNLPGFICSPRSYANSTYSASVNWYIRHWFSGECNWYKNNNSNVSNITSSTYIDDTYYTGYWVCGAYDGISSGTGRLTLSVSNYLSQFSNGVLTVFPTYNDSVAITSINIDSYYAYAGYEAFYVGLSSRNCSFSISRSS